MKKLSILAILFYIIGIARGQTAYWQQQVNYKIDVTLNDTKNTLDGFAKIEYYNNSPDTLYFIWFHLWPNAYKNDRTAFSDQLLENARTDFYFSNSDQRGYINRLDFRVNGVVAKTADHPQHQDIIQVILPEPLPPHSSINIQTPFHEQLPFNFSRGGHVDQSYQVTQWYPKPAVYDQKGWHPMPYLEQGEFYSEFGNYEVQITLPKNYLVAATGILQDEEEKDWLKQKAATRLVYDVPVVKKAAATLKKTVVESDIPASSSTQKTIHFKQDQVHDFAWFADKRFALKQDTLLLPSGKIIDVAAYFINRPTSNALWKKSIQFIKKSVLTHSNWLGEYPYNTVTAVEAATGIGGGMEYPTITSIPPARSEESLERTIEHEVGHNWNYGILASNERDHPWMDEGINSYYDARYKQTGKTIANEVKPKPGFINSRMPDDFPELGLRIYTSMKKDQPIETTSEHFSEFNYGLIAYYKTSQWMRLLERKLGTEMFDSCMHEYYRRWQFKHPYPEDFKRVIEEVSGNNMDAEFALLSKKGMLQKPNAKKDIKLASFFNLKETDRHHYIYLAPLAGYNSYDKLMIGGLIHTYTLPAEKLQFAVAPLYAPTSKQLNGIGTINYHWLPDNRIQKVVIGLNGERFSTNHSLDTNQQNIYERFYKLVPYLKIYFKSKPRSSGLSWIDIRTYFISEKQFDNYDYIAGSDSFLLYPNSTTKSSRYINQLSFNRENNRVLYPYNYQLQLQQGKGFYRVNITGNYFFNYSKGGGLSARVFAAKFGNIGNDPTYFTYQYQPKLLSADGTDDYTYSNYFLGRSASTAYGDIPVSNGGIGARQVMIPNTGGLKFRLDPFSTQGRSSNWIAAVNLSSTLPDKLFPAKIPLKLFFDVGTYAEAWEKTNTSSRFLYVGGLQLSLFKNILNIYAPIIYSKEFKDYLKTDKEANKFFKKLTFSIDIQNLRLKKFFPQYPF
ncbi:hypothetical protein BH11BAC3_BH11BAC3_29180 [soil metagenome]